MLRHAGWGGLVLRSLLLTVNYRSPYNKAMTKDLRENRLKARIRDIADFYHHKGRMLSFSEIGEMAGIKSKNAVYKLVNKLENSRFWKGRQRQTPYQFL